MKLLSLTVLGAILLVAAPSAFAFQESQTGTTSSKSAPQSAPQAGSQANFGSDSAAKPSSSGTAVRIPGLGTLGVLPKMDFGLELLYGAADKGVSPTEPPAISTDDDDLRLRGTVRHKF